MITYFEKMIKLAVITLSDLYCFRVIAFLFKLNNIFQGLLEVTSKTVALMIKGKTQAEINLTFNINDEFTHYCLREVEKLTVLFVCKCVRIDAGGGGCRD